MHICNCVVHKEQQTKLLYIVLLKYATPLLGSLFVSSVKRVTASKGRKTQTITKEN
jgi:hypothetical protein